MLCLSHITTLLTSQMESTTHAKVHRAPEKGEYFMIIWDIFSYFSMKPYVVTPHLNRLVQTVQMMGYNIGF